MVDNVVTLPSGETVTLRKEVTIPLGVAALSVMRNAKSIAEIEGGLAEVYLRLGIESWSFVEEGRPVPVTPANIDRLLPYAEGGLEVAERADDLYSTVVMRPLVRRSEKSSSSTPTDGQTSPTPDSGSTRPSRSRPSSPRNTAGAPT